MEISTRPRSSILYVKVRGQPPGFWGLTANRVIELATSGLPWHVVLLLGSAEYGYVISSGEIQRRTDGRVWTLSDDGDYKINEGTDIESDYRFDSFEELMHRVFS
jgi:hypothetical protein